MANPFGSIPASFSAARSGSASTHASAEGPASTASTTGASSSGAAATAASSIQTPDARRHGLGLINGESYASSPSQTSSPSYHQYQSSRQAPVSHQSQQFQQQQQSYHQQYQHQHQQHHYHHHAANNSIGSSSGFRQDSTDSGLTPTFSTSNVMHSSPNLMSDSSEPPSQPHSSNAMSANASSQLLIASIVQRLVNKVSSAAYRRSTISESSVN